MKIVKDKFVPVIVDMDREPDWVARHKLQGPPGVVWATSEGDILVVSLETASVEDILADIDDALFELEGGDDEEDMSEDMDEE